MEVAAGAGRVGGPGSLAGGELAVGGCILTALRADFPGPGGLPTCPVPLGDILALLLGLGCALAVTGLAHPALEVVVVVGSSGGRLREMAVLPGGACETTVVVLVGILMPVDVAAMATGCIVGVIPGGNICGEEVTCSCACCCTVWPGLNMI